jgi:hypothetical protein
MHLPKSVNECHLMLQQWQCLINRNAYTSDTYQVTHYNRILDSVFRPSVDISQEEEKIDYGANMSVNDMYDVWSE